MHINSTQLQFKISVSIQFKSMMNLGAKRSFSSSKRTMFLQDIAKNIGSGYNSLKGTLMQVMAQRMNETDRQSMMNHWGSTLEPPIAKVELREPTPHQRTLPVPNLDILSNIEERNIFHPVLGELISDLGYKKVYLTNVRSLAMAPVWKRQRILRPERSKLIAAEKIKNKLGSSISGTISFFLNKSTHEIGIIDGQHRAGALMLLAQKGYWSESERNILVEVFVTETNAQVSALFREINAAEPVRMVDMVAHEEPADADVDKDYSVDADGDVGSEEEMHEVAATTAVVTHSSNNSSSNSSSSGCDRERREGGPPQQPDHHQQQQQQPDYQEILTAAADQLALQYAEMFKPSSRCKPPHLNVDVLRDDLYQSGFLARHSPQAATAQQLLDLLERVNQSVKSQMLQEQQQGKEKNVPPPSKSAQAALRKAGEHDFFLGMDKAWMYQTYT